MPIEKKPMRFAHTEGHTCVCYDETGRHLLTGGADGDVRIWDGFDDDDAVSHRAGEKVYCMAYKNDRFYTASDDNAIKVHLFKDGQADGIVTRFTSPVTHMAFNKNGTSVLAGSSDFLLKVVDLDTSSQQVFQGHDAPVLSVAYDPKEEYVASSSCDGSTKIWKIESQQCVKTLDAVLPKSNDISNSKTLCRISWDKSGKHLAVPVEKEIRLYERSTWDIKCTLADSEIQHLVSVVSFSPCGQYLASACVDGLFLIWDIQTKKCVTREKHEKKLTVCDLAWDPRNNGEIAYTDTEGQMGMLSGVISPPTDQSAEGTSGEQFEGLFEDDDDMIMDATGAPATADAGDNSDDDDMAEIRKLKRAAGIIDEDSKDTDMMSKDGLDTKIDDLLSDVKPDQQGAGKSDVIHRPAYEGPKFAPLQKPFQPSSTPEHLAHRFMVWNSVGIIKQYNTDDENSIEIEFHDTSVHHAMHVSNTLGHSMADMSNEAVVLACKSDDDTPSKLVCLHFSSWDSSKEWTVSMPDDEEIMAITIGDGWIAAATDKRLVRLFSVGGLQLQVLSLPGPVVSLAAHGNQLLVAYHQGMGIPGDQCLGYRLQYVRGKKRTSQSESLPLSCKSILTWLGFTAEGTPCAADSNGIVRMLHRKFGNSWVQVANTKAHCKGKSDHYWIVGLVENPQQLRCIPCKGSMYPPTLPRPAVSVIPFQLPFCETASDKGQLEESLLRNRLFSCHYEHLESQGYEVDEQAKRQATLTEQESLMKLFALACKTEHEFRATEICELMPSHHPVQLAMKYASRLRMLQLAERVGEIARRKAEEEFEAEEEEEEEMPVMARPAIRRTAAAEVEEDEEVEEYAEENGDVEMQEEHTPSGPMLKLDADKSEKYRQSLPSSATRKNPFKLGGSQNLTPTSTKGTSVFDNMTPQSGAKSSSGKKIQIVNSAGAKSKKKQQPRLFGPAKSTKEQSASSGQENQPKPENKKPKSAFQLWFDENKTSLQEENPEAEEPDLVLLATRKFRELTKEQKEEWSKKAKGISSTESESNSETKKRKRAENETDLNTLSKTSKVDLPSKKKPLSQSTNSKLSEFAFDKK